MGTLQYFFAVRIRGELPPTPSPPTVTVKLTRPRFVCAVEEKYLVKFFGKQYEDYRAKVPTRIMFVR